LTKETIAQFLKVPLILNNEVLNNIKNFFRKTKRKFYKTNIKQAYFPENSIILNNPIGTAAGCIIKKDNKYFILLPGPLKEVSAIFEDSLYFYLEKFSTKKLYSKILRIIGISESEISAKIPDLLSLSNPTVAPYYLGFEVILRLTAAARNQKQAKKLIYPIEKKIREKFGIAIYGEDNTTIEDEIYKLLKKLKLTIAIAESCTGGLVTGRLVNVAGISEFFKESIVCYSNEAKIKRLGINEEKIKKYGAVSKEIAIEMAEKIGLIANTDIGLSITGIAGPGGGTNKKPVGLVYFGLFLNKKKNYTKQIFQGDRNSIRQKASVFGLDWLRKNLIN